jgi:hypothetical protein
MYAHTSEPPPALSSVAGAVPPALDAVVARALAKEPDARYPSAGDFARAVSAAVMGQAPSEPERTVAVGRAAPGPPVPPAPTAAAAATGATAALPPAPAPPTPAPAPAMAAPVPGPHPVYGYGLDPATAVLPEKRRSPWVAVIAILAVLLVGGGVAAAVLLTGNEDKAASPPAASNPQGPTVQDGVAQIAAALDLSQRGRTLTIAGQYDAAIANRSEVLDKVDGLTLAPELEPSRTLLRAAVQASLDADRALQRCSTCSSTTAANNRATDLKQRFVLEFNPLATKYLQRSFDSNSL